MTTTAEQQAACFDQVDQIISRYRAAVSFSGATDFYRAAFDQIERVAAGGRRELAAMKSAAPVTTDRRRALLSTTPAGRAVLAADAQKNSGRVTLSGMSSSRRKALLSASPWGSQILADEARERRK